MGTTHEHLFASCPEVCDLSGRRTWLYWRFQVNSGGLLRFPCLEDTALGWGQSLHELSEMNLALVHMFRPCAGGQSNGFCHNRRERALPVQAQFTVDHFAKIVPI